MRLLLDSSGPALVLGLHDGTRLLAELREPGRPPEGRDIGTSVDAMRAEYGRPPVHSLVVGLGPGSFIGTRVAISFANGWRAAAAGVELLGVGSLAAISAEHNALPVLRDARRGQWYLYTPASAAGAAGCRALPLSEALAALSASGQHNVVVEQADASPAASGRARPSEVPALLEALDAAGIKACLCSGVSSLGLQLAASMAEPVEWAEPLYLRSFL